MRVRLPVLLCDLHRTVRWPTAEAWGGYVYAKVNAVPLFEAELAKLRRSGRGTITPARSKRRTVSREIPKVVATSPIRMAPSLPS